MMLYDSSIRVIDPSQDLIAPRFFQFSITLNSLLPIIAILFQKFVKIRFFLLSFFQKKLASITTILRPVFPILLFISPSYNIN